MTPLRVVVAPDKFKESLTAVEAAERITAGIRRSRPDVDIATVPVADGGDGTVAAVAVAGFTTVRVVVSGPTSLPVDAVFARRGDMAVVELAEASGLRRLAGGRPEPMRASSRGTGELVRAALNLGCRQIVLGVGGSASTDGGAGMLSALGARLLDAGGRELGDGGSALLAVRSVDLSGLDPRLAGTTVTLASDVDNPLLGPHGAAAVYGPQKGAGSADVETLEVALSQWRDAMVAAVGRDESTAAGAGAAGGAGFAAMAALGASTRSGIELVLELVGFDAHVAGARLAITGEGSLDEQSLHGKAPVGVAAAARRHGVPTIALVGRCALKPRQVMGAGFLAAYPITDLEPDPAVCMRQAGRLLEDLAAGVVERHLEVRPAASP